MNLSQSKLRRLLAISPSTRGFGFAVLENQERLVDWGVKSIAKDKNVKCLAKVEELIAHYRPDILALEEHSAKGSRRSARIRILGREIVDLVAKCKVRV